MGAASIDGLTSIIVPCCNQREFTRLCFQALFQHTRPAWELIVVDNGSTDGTGTYLEGVRDTAPVPVTVFANEQNLGFPRTVNQGLQAARGEFLVLLNNDAVVTDGWLDQLIALSRARLDVTGETRKTAVANAEGAERRTEGPETETESKGGLAGVGISLVGPMSNYAAPPQLVENVTYRDLDEMHALARRWRDEHRGQWFNAGKLSGFCLLFTQAVYDAIGGLDERFGLGLFDDDDLAVRARRARFGLAVARDLFIHHFGSRTFAGNGIDAERLLEENARRFAAKWGQDAAPRAAGYAPELGVPGPSVDRGGRRMLSADGRRWTQMGRKHGDPADAGFPGSKRRGVATRREFRCTRSVRGQWFDRPLFSSASICVHLQTGILSPIAGAAPEGHLDPDRPRRAEEPAALSRVGARGLRRDRRRGHRQP